MTDKNNSLLLTHYSRRCAWLQLWAVALPCYCFDPVGVGRNLDRTVTFGFASFEIVLLYGNEYLVCAERHGTILVMPFTIHAAWIRVDEPGSTSQLFLWAEDPDVVAKASPAFATMAPEADRSANFRHSNGRSTSSRSATGRLRGPKVPSHPAQVSIGQLRALLTGDPIHVEVNQLQPANARVWLPSQGGMPLTRRSVFQSNGSGRSGMVRVAEALRAPQQ